MIWKKIRIRNVQLKIAINNLQLAFFSISPTLCSYSDFFSLYFFLSSFDLPIGISFYTFCVVFFLFFFVELLWKWREKEKSRHYAYRISERKANGKVYFIGLSEKKKSPKLISLSSLFSKNITLYECLLNVSLSHSPFPSLPPHCL